MQKYILRNDSKKSKREYITEVKDMGDGTLDVYFADGSVFHKVSYNEDNLKKIEEIQEKQAEKGIEEYIHFSFRKTTSKAMAIAAPLLAFSGSMGIVSDQSLSLGTNNPLVVATGVGVITILSSIPMGIKFVRDRKTLAELDKIEYRNKHRDKLDSYKCYENSLAGVSEKVQEKLLHKKNPFSILNIDNFSKSDLEKIVNNINKERRLQFQYSKRKNI